MSDPIPTGATAGPEILTAELAPHWPELFERLGSRAQDYVQAAITKAAFRQISQPACIARFVNLCCALGPNFEDKPENEWALAILSDDRLEEWVKLHQIVVRAASELGRRVQGNRSNSVQFVLADRVLLDAEDSRRKAIDANDVSLARVACDIDSIEIRLMELEWRREYTRRDGAWQLSNVPAFASSVRFGQGKTATSIICVLTGTVRQAPAARLQIRLATQFQCDQDRHPLAVFAGTHGLWQWRGHQAKSVSWQVFALPPRAEPVMKGVPLMAETLPDASVLRASSCGLRDDGVPTGSLETYVWAFPADQYLFVLNRKSTADMVWPKQPASSAGNTAGATVCRFERDGAVLASKDWAQGFQDSLHTEMILGFDKIFAAWGGAMQDASMRSTSSLLTGTCTLTWGWREGAGGLLGSPVMRVLGDFDLSNLLDLELVGEIAIGVTRTRVRLTARSDAPMKHQITRENETPGLVDIILPLAKRWQAKFQVEFEPVAVEQAAMWSSTGSCTGCLSGEVGLRPRLGAGGGWQWYARLSCEAISVPICLFDPLLGQTHQTLMLLPATNMLDWSFG